MPRTRLRVLTNDQVERFHADGSLSIPGVFTPAEMDAALEASDRLTYGMSFERWKREVVAEGKGRDITDYGSANPSQNPGRAQFPTGEPALDNLLNKPIVLDIAADIAGTEELSYLNGHMFVRAGPTDTRFPAQPWEGFHFDHASGSFLPPWDEPGRFDYLGCGVLLTDVDEGCAPVVQVPGSHRGVSALLPRLVKEGVCAPPSGFSDVRRIPEFAKRTTWTGRRGTLGIGSSYGVHAAAPFADKQRQRAWWTVSFNRSADLPFNRWTTAFAGAERARLIAYLNHAPARVRALFGWPSPGHPYYTPATLAALHAWYPDMDLSAYRDGMAASRPRSAARAAPTRSARRALAQAKR